MPQTLITAQKIEQRIFSVRGHRVILDADLAAVYGVPTHRLNEQVRRNCGRFPPDFSFLLTRQEVANLISQSAISSSSWGGRRKPPTVFTEHGAIMAASVLNSERAIAMSIYVIRAFIRIREALLVNHALEARLAHIEKTLLSHDSAVRDLYEKIRPLLLPPPEPPPRRMGFHGD